MAFAKSSGLGSHGVSIFASYCLKGIIYGRYPQLPTCLHTESQPAVNSSRPQKRRRKNPVTNHPVGCWYYTIICLRWFRYILKNLTLQGSMLLKKIVISLKSDYLKEHNKLNFY